MAALTLGALARSSSLPAATLAQQAAEAALQLLPQLLLPATCASLCRRCRAIASTAVLCQMCGAGPRGTGRLAGDELPHCLEAVCRAAEQAVGAAAACTAQPRQSEWATIALPGTQPCNIG